MRIIIFSLVLLTATLFSTHVFSASYTIDPEHTYPSFEISHLGFSTTRGRFEKTSGKLTMDLAKKTGAIEIIIDADSIKIGRAHV